MFDVYLRRLANVSPNLERMSHVSSGAVAITLMIVTGSTYNAFAKQLGEVLSPFSLLLVSEIIMGLFVLFAFGAVPTIKQLEQIPRAHWRHYAVVAAGSAVVGPMLMFAGLQRTTAINASLFASVDILFTIVLASMFLAQRFTLAHWRAASIVLLGTATVALNGFTTGIELQSGDIIILFATFVFSCSTIYFRSTLAHTSAHRFLVVRITLAIAGLLALSPLVSTSLATEMARLPGYLVLVLLSFALLSRFASMYAFYSAVDHVPICVISLCANLGVIGSVLFAHLYAGEAIAWYHFVGGALIVTGTVLFEHVQVPELAHAARHTRSSHHR